MRLSSGVWPVLSISSEISATFPKHREKQARKEMVIALFDSQTTPRAQEIDFNWLLQIDTSPRLR